MVGLTNGNTFTAVPTASILRLGATVPMPSTDCPTAILLKFATVQLVGVLVAVLVGVWVGGVPVAVFVAVFVGVWVGGVPVGVLVAVFVDVEVSLLVGVGVTLHAFGS